MKKNNCTLTLLFLSVFYCAVSIYASPVHIAASCGQADVQAAINAAADNDTVAVPKGIGTWASAVTIGEQVTWNPNTFTSKKIVLRGAGMDSTVIVSSSGTRLLGIIVVENKPVRVTGFTFKGMKILSRTEPAIEISGHDFRIDHCTFGETGKAGIQGRGIIAYSTRGLIDHCTFIDTKQGIEADGDGDVYGEPVLGTASWNRPVTPGAVDALYIEDCLFNYSDALDGAIDTYTGARYVFRYNTVVNTNAGGHGRDSGGLRSPLWFEYYGNTFSSALSGGPIRALFFRGGTGVLFNNTWTGNFGTAIPVVYYCACPSYYTSCGWPQCTSYPCIDQTGRGPDMDSNGVQDVVPLYEWSNTRNGNDIDIAAENGGGTCNPPMSFFIQEGRDYYNDTPRPGYTPYTYPHPLAGGSSAITHRAMFNTRLSPGLLLKSNFLNRGMVEYRIPSAGKITLEVYTLAGKHKETLEKGYKEAGMYSAAWNTAGYSSGVYVFKLKSGEREIAGKGLLLQ